MALLAVVVGALIFAWPKVHPSSFAKLPQRWQGLPAVLVAAALAALSSGGDLVAMVGDAAMGAFGGLAAVGGHHAVIKRLMGAGGEKAPS